jgi:peroxygenase
MWKAMGVAVAAAVAGAGCVEHDTADVTAEEQALWWDESRAEPAIPWDEMTALQRHVAFFDYDGDGYITVTEDYRGLRELGIWPGPAWAFALAINGALGTPTMGYPSLTISVYGIDRGMHGSDTGIYDEDGEFVPEAFEALFDEWDLDGSDGLSAVELAARTIDDAELGDVFGLTASVAEFGLLFVIAAEDGEISRDRMRGFYEGTLFYDLAGVPYPQ